MEILVQVSKVIGVVMSDDLFSVHPRYDNAGKEVQLGRNVNLIFQYFQIFVLIREDHNKPLIYSSGLLQ